MTAIFRRVLEDIGLDPHRAAETAEIFTNNSADGIVSHGVNRFPQFVEHLRLGVVRIDGKLAQVSGEGPLERWDGGCGIGPLNARECTDRAIFLADIHGVGIVALRNNSHWMRPGAYGFRAADAGYPFICWSNTRSNMPPWGSDRPRVGNNPIVMAVPRSKGPVVLDMALSQFSYGRMDSEARAHRKLPVPGGYDNDGHITDDPAAILHSGRPLPIGYWKGSGLSLLLDLLAAILSGGSATKDVTNYEENLSQVFIAFAPDHLGGAGAIEAAVDGVISDFQSRAVGEKEVRYPGEAVVRRRAESRKLGVLVDREVWKDIQKLLPMSGTL